MADQAVALTHARLKSLLHYDPQTGIFTWLWRAEAEFKTKNAHRTWNSRYAGGEAGVTTHGYRKISIDDRKYYAHRLAWFYVTGKWPASLIDHRNEAGGDNRWGNLRESTKSTNGANRLLPRRDNATGFKGVTRHKSGYVAQCAFGGGPHYIGLYKTPEEAHAAYVKVLTERAGEFSPFNRETVLSPLLSG